MKNVPREEQKQHLIDMMKGDEELGFYEGFKQKNTMKTAQEKAKELISLNSLTILSVVGNKLTMDEVKEIAKQFALLELDEILHCIKWHLYPLNKEWTYFEEIQEEIEKL